MKVNYEDIFEHIGYLTYSMALPHGALSERSVVKLKNLIDLLWIDKDPLSMHLNDCAKAGITYCLDNFMTSEHAFSSFVNYFRIHRLPFGKPLQQRIISLTQEVFAAFPSPEGATRVELVGQILADRNLSKPDTVPF
jgi:hypothetical protein